MALSPRLGRTSSKEQYAYLYRPSHVIPTVSYTYNDSQSDIFEREPYIFSFSFSSSLYSNPQLDNTFFLIGIHTKPSDAVAEINALTSVFNQTSKNLTDASGIVLGDLNAGCSYVTASEWPSISLRNDTQSFYWPLNDTVDTTITASDCPYDRFVLSTTIKTFQSASIFDFQTAYNISSYLSLNTSDHWPIELVLSFPDDSSGGSEDGAGDSSATTPSSNVASSSGSDIGLGVGIAVAVVLLAGTVYYKQIYSKK